MTTRFFDVNGIRLAAGVAGPAHGTPLVLLHGAGNDRSSWDPVLPALSADRPTYAVDLRGSGDSDRPGAYSFELMRDDVLGLIDQLGSDRYDLIGHSMGATIAWLVAQRRSERIRRLIVEDSAPPRVSRGIDIGPRPVADPPYDWDALAALVGQLNAPDPRWWEGIPLVTAPTLVIAGGPTSHVPQQDLAEAARLVPDGRLVEIPVGHRVHRDAPAEFVATVRSFLD
jgi:3-oxoadipate enol-lactonase